MLGVCPAPPEGGEGHHVTVSLHVVYPELPPSSNKIYFQGTKLTRTAREYAEAFAM